VTPFGIARIERLGLVASVQPNFVGNWSAKGEFYDQRIGSRRQGKANPFRRMLGAGLCLAFGSDNRPFSPFYGIHSAVNAPFPGQRLRLREALTAYTRDAAFAIQEETSRGTLEVGKLADVAVLDGNPFDAPAEIKERRVPTTFFRGEVAHGAKLRQLVGVTDPPANRCACRNRRRRALFCVGESAVVDAPVRGRGLVVNSARRIPLADVVRVFLPFNATPSNGPSAHLKVGRDAPQGLIVFAGFGHPRELKQVRAAHFEFEP
jgi:hypothetical protein